LWVPQTNKCSDLQRLLTDLSTHCADTFDILGQFGLTDLDLNRIKTSVHIFIHALHQARQIIAQVNTPAIGVAPIPRAARHMQKGCVQTFATQIPQCDIHCRYGKGCDTTSGHIVHMPLHAVIKGINVLRVLTNQKRDQVMMDHHLNRTAAFATRIGIPRSRDPVRVCNCHRDQFEMSMGAVFGILQDFIQGGAKILNADVLDRAHIMFRSNPRTQERA
jgi:hypothetical protein